MITAKKQGFFGRMLRLPKDRARGAGLASRCRSTLPKNPSVHRLEIKNGRASVGINALTFAGAVSQRGGVFVIDPAALPR